MIQVAIDIVALISIYSIVVLGLGFISGMGGIYSVCQAAFFAIGAFSYAGMYAFHKTTDLLVTLPLAALVGAAFSAALSLVARRVSGEAFVVASFGLQIVFISVLYNWDSVSGGPSGVYGLPLPSFAGMEMRTPLQNTIFILFVTMVCFGGAYWIRRAPFGRLIRAMGSDESALQAAGFPPFRLKVSVFVLGGTLAAIAGVLYASYLGIAQTGDFDVNASITLLAAVMVGGARSLIGPIIGAILFVGFPRVLTLFNMPESVAGPAQQLLFGVLLIVIMLFVPGGIASLALGRGARHDAEVAEGRVH